MNSRKRNTQLVFFTPAQQFLFKSLYSRQSSSVLSFPLFSCSYIFQLVYSWHNQMITFSTSSYRHHCKGTLQKMFVIAKDISMQRIYMCVLYVSSWWNKSEAAYILSTQVSYILIQVKICACVNVIFWMQHEKGKTRRSKLVFTYWKKLCWTLANPKPITRWKKSGRDIKQDPRGLGSFQKVTLQTVCGENSVFEEKVKLEYISVWSNARVVFRLKGDLLELASWIKKCVM